MFQLYIQADRGKRTNFLSWSSISANGPR